MFIQFKSILISVIIPLYNKENFISNALESLLQQTYSNFELIIVNDGSTDDSLQKVNQFDDGRIVVITINNSGVSVARNTGIKAAKYKWIAFLDADDWWEPTFLEEMVKAINRYDNNRIFASGRNRVFKNVTERYENEYLPGEGKTESINYFKVISNYLPPVNSSNVVLDKSLFNEFGYFKEGQEKYEDHDLWMRICVKHLVVFVNKPLSFYRKTELNTASKNVYTAKDFLSYLKTLIDISEKVSLEEKKYIMSYTNRFVLLTFIKYHNKYSSGERREVFNLAKKLLSKKNLFIIRIVRLFPFDLYYILKKVKM